MVQLGTTEALCFHHISDDIVHFKLKPSTHVHNRPIILQIEPIILKIFHYAFCAYYSQNYAGMLGSGLLGGVES